MGPVLVMSNTTAVNFATFNLLKSTTENAYNYVIFGVFFLMKFKVEYESENQIFFN